MPLTADIELCAPNGDIRLCQPYTPGMPDPGSVQPWVGPGDVRQCSTDICPGVPFTLDTHPAGINCIDVDQQHLLLQYVCDLSRSPLFQIGRRVLVTSADNPLGGASADGIGAGPGICGVFLDSLGSERNLALFGGGIAFVCQSIVKPVINVNYQLVANDFLGPNPGRLRVQVEVGYRGGDPQRNYGPHARSRVTIDSIGLQ